MVDDIKQHIDSINNLTEETNRDEAIEKLEDIINQVGKLLDDFNHIASDFIDYSLFETVIGPIEEELYDVVEEIKFDNEEDEELDL